MTERHKESSTLTSSVSLVTIAKYVKSDELENKMVLGEEVTSRRRQKPSGLMQNAFEADAIALMDKGNGACSSSTQDKCLLNTNKRPSKKVITQDGITSDASS